MTVTALEIEEPILAAAARDLPLAKGPTQTSTAGLPLSSVWTFSWPAPCFPYLWSSMIYLWSSMIYGVQCRICPASLAATGCSSEENVPFQIERHSGGQQDCSPSPGIDVRLQSGILFRITTEWRSASAWNRVHLRPE